MKAPSLLLTLCAGLALAGASRAGEAVPVPADQAEQVVIDPPAIAPAGGRPAILGNFTIIAGEPQPAEPVSWMGVGTEAVLPEPVDPENPTPEDFFDEGAGLLVKQVIIGSPAQAAGLLVGDVLVKLDDHWLQTPTQLRSLVQHHPPGEVVQVAWFRKGARMTADIKLEAMDPAQLVAAGGGAVFGINGPIIRVNGGTLKINGINTTIRQGGVNITVRKTLILGADGTVKEVDAPAAAPAPAEAPAAPAEPELAPKAAGPTPVGGEVPARK